MIDIVVSLVHKVEKLWVDKKLVTILFIAIKEAFDHISRTIFVERMIGLGVDDDLIQWTKSFLID